MNPSDGARRDAARLTTLVCEREPGALIDLANWLHADGVSLEQMDGSLQSLVPLWVWFKAQIAADCPALEPGQTGIQQTYHSFPPDMVRPTVLSETVAFYVMQVCRRFDPRAFWDVELGYLVYGYGRPIARLSNGMNHVLFIMMNNVRSQLEGGRQQRDRDDSLQTVMQMRLGESEALTRRGPSILAPLVGLVAPRVDYTAITIDIPEPEPRVASKDQAYGDYILGINFDENERRVENDEEDVGLEGLVPLPTEAVVAFLNDAGFTLDGPVTVELIRDSKDFLVSVGHKDYWAFAEINVHDGLPRFIRFKAWVSTKAEWRGLLKKIRVFGATIGARLTL